MSYRLENLFAGYRARPVLRNLSGEIKPGRITALLGPNGSGKSTLLGCLAGLLPHEGNLFLRDLPEKKETGQAAPPPSEHRVRKLSRRELGLRIGFVPQDPLLRYPFAVYEVILLGRLPHVRSLAGYAEEDRRMAASAASRLGLGDLLSRSVAELSGGERQRVAVAQILAQNPQVLLLDEPSSSLDPRHGAELFALLRETALEGRTVVASVHDVNLAARWCDDVWVLLDGELLAAGSVTAVLREDLLRKAYGVSFARYAGEDGVVWHPRL